MAIPESRQPHVSALSIIDMFPLTVTSTTTFIQIMTSFCTGIHLDTAFKQQSVLALYCFQPADHGLLLSGGITDAWC